MAENAAKLQSNLVQNGSKVWHHFFLFNFSAIFENVKLFGRRFLGGRAGGGCSSLF